MAGGSSKEVAKISQTDKENAKKSQSKIQMLKDVKIELNKFIENNKISKRQSNN